MPLFGKKKVHPWKEFADEIGARFEPAGFLKTAKVFIAFRNWTIVIDSYTTQHVTYTQIFAIFNNLVDFKMSVHKQGFLAKIEKMLGFQDIIIGNPQIDEAFVIKGNNEALVSGFFSGVKIREMFLALSEMPFQFDVKRNRGVSKNREESLREICYNYPEMIKDKEMLRAIVELVEESLVQLANIGVTSNRAPELKSFKKSFF